MQSEYSPSAISNSEVFHEPCEGDTRITVPVPSAAILTEDRYLIDYPYRVSLLPGIELTYLHEEERDRLNDGPYGIHACFRLEIFQVAPESGFDYFDDGVQEQLTGLVRSTLSKLSLCVRGYFNVSYAVVDQFDGSVWRRMQHLNVREPLRQLGFSHIPVSRLDTWSGLLTHWPSQPDPALALALQYYCESLLDRAQKDYHRAVVSAAIATEVLFGERGGEITYRISTRAAQLVATGEDAVMVQKAIKKLYKIRSGVVHSGKGASKSVVDLWHQFLMCAIPSIAAWPGSLVNLRETLDRASFTRDVDLDVVTNSDGWWNYCDFVYCLKRSGFVS